MMSVGPESLRRRPARFPPPTHHLSPPRKSQAAACAARGFVGALDALCRSKSTRHRTCARAALRCAGAIQRVRPPSAKKRMDALEEPTRHRWPAGPRDRGRRAGLRVIAARRSAHVPRPHAEVRGPLGGVECAPTRRTTTNTWLPDYSAGTELSFFGITMSTDRRVTRRPSRSDSTGMVLLRTARLELRRVTAEVAPPG